MSAVLPGTVHLVDLKGDLEVKKAGKGNKNIILRPPPSNDLNDPLRWPGSKKLKQFFLLFWWSVNLAVAGNWTTPIWITFMEEFNCTVHELNNALAFLFAFLGLGCLFMQPTAMKLGRRFVYLVCTALMLVANIIGSQMTKVQQFYGVLIIQGVGGAPCDSLVQISTTDVFFQHERATYLSLFVFSLYFGNFLGPTVSGYIADAIGWRWGFYLLIISFASFTIVMLFYMEDTTFRRNNDGNAVETDILDQIKSRESGVKLNGNVKVEECSNETDVDIPLRGYWQRMKIVQTQYNDPRPWFTIFCKPFFLLGLPSVVWAGVSYGAQMMWTSYMSTTQAEVFGLPPYNFESGKIGLTNLAPLIGNICGMIYGGKFVDWISIWLAKRNNGVMEAEFRLYAMAGPTIINAAGILAYSLGSDNGAPWPIGVVLGYGFMGFAMTSTGAITMTYSIDCYPKLGSEAMVLILFIRNMIGMVFTFAFQYWLDRCGFKLLGWLLFMISIIINGSFLFMIVFGKKLREKTFNYYTKISDSSL